MIAKSRLGQPPGGYPREAASFLRSLASIGTMETACLPKSMRGDGGTSEWASWLRGHGLASYAYWRLKEVGLLGQLDVPVHAELRKAYYAAVGDAELHRAELVEVLGALADAGVSAVLFKGAVLAYAAYPDPACRPMGDLDLWVTAESMAKAQVALESAGYRQVVKESRPVAFQAQAGGEVQLIGRVPGQGLVELHYGVFAGEWVRRTTTVAADCIACRSVPVTVAGCPAWALGPEDAILQLAVHVAVNHQMSYPGVRALLDVVLQARAQPPDWGVLAERARKWRVATAIWLVLAMADAMFGLPGADGTLAALRPSLVHRHLLGWFTNEETLLAGRDITGGPARLLYQLLVVDRLSDAARLVVRTLWPEKEWLALRYGRSGPAVRVRHLGNALRGEL